MTASFISISDSPKFKKNISQADIFSKNDTQLVYSI